MSDERNTFSPAYANAILTQKKEGTICAECGFTEVEHVFEPEKCCHRRSSDRKAQRGWMGARSQFDMGDE